MSTAPPDLDELRERVRRLEGRPAALPVATHPALAGLLQMQGGGVYATGSTSLTGLLMAGPSTDGAWAGIVGSAQREMMGGAQWGLEALEALGVRLDRCVLVPDPQQSWLEVTAALVDVLGVVVVRPPTTVGEHDASRLAARLRKRGSVLIVQGQWPRADAQLSMSQVQWVGVDQGHGHLQARQVTVEVTLGTAPARTRRLWLPDHDLQITRVAEQPARLDRRRVG